MNVNDLARVVMRLLPALPPVSQTERDSTTRWVTFKDAVHQVEFTHQELLNGIRTGSIAHQRHAQGRLMLEVQSLQDFHPDETWITFDNYASNFSFILIVTHISNYKG